MSSSSTSSSRVAVIGTGLVGSSWAAAVAGADYVQESIAESLPAKRALFAELDADCRERWPDEQRSERLATRDQRLLALAAHLSTQR